MNERQPSKKQGLRSWLLGLLRRLAAQRKEAERRRLDALVEKAVMQGQAVRRWWSRADELSRSYRWIDHDSVAALARTRPATDAWTALEKEPRLAGTVAGWDALERRAFKFCRTGDLKAWAAQVNDFFLEYEKREFADFFRTVEKSPLTDEQMRATVCFDNRVRVIAAAGSGKTSTMVARAGYAIRRRIAEPDQILALAFNRKAAGELSERMQSRLGGEGAGVVSSTFHAYGLRIIGEATGSKPSVPDDLVNGQGLRRLEGVVTKLREQDPNLRRDWDLFRFVFGGELPEFGDEPEDSEESEGSKIHRAMDGTPMKSREEVMIADWLFVHGVKYEYERPYAFDTVTERYGQYHPDFYYPDIDVWHEHFALDRDGRPPPQFEGYAEKTRWRRETHARYGTVLVETTSATIRDGSAFEYLERKLRKHGIELVFDPYREARVDPPISDNALLTLVGTFMKHAKGNRLTAGELTRRAGSSVRSRLFLRLYAPIVAEWDRQLRAAGQVDFEDMLNLATDHVEAGRWTSPFRVVMVDEMQDTSAARAALVRALAKTPGTYLYAVGDDWQSVNRFAGADIGIMTRFDQWFGAASTVLLDRTFRSP